MKDKEKTKLEDKTMCYLDKTEVYTKKRKRVYLEEDIKQAIKNVEEDLRQNINNKMKHHLHNYIFRDFFLVELNKALDKHIGEKGGSLR